MNQTITKLAPAFSPVRIVNTPAFEGEPAKVLEYAHKAAKALTDVIKSKPHKVVIRGQEYLTYEDWQTVARFYGVTVGVEWSRSTTNEKKVFGYESRAVAYKDGVIISAAEASCFRDEPNWEDKPSFQIRSMSQTRSCAKCLRNVLAWVVVLAGYNPCPADELIENEPAFSQVPVDDNDTSITAFSASENYRGWENRNDGITEKQTKLLQSLIVEKVENEVEREERLQGINDLTKNEASQLIGQLLNNQLA